MAVIVGTLQVNVTTGQATLQFDDAKSQMDAFGKSAADTGQKLDYSMRESRESVMLTAEALGVHLPAGITRVIAGIGPLGAALAAALPVAAIIAGIALIISHYEKLAEAIAKAQAEAAKSAITNADETKSIELTNLKLDDQIAKLEHKPTHNYMAEAILETSKDVDELLSKYSADMAKMTTITEDQTHFWVSLWRGVKDAFSGVGQGQGYGTVTKQWEDLKQRILDVQTAQKNLAEAPLDSKNQTAGREQVITALKAEQVAIAGLQVIYRNNKQQLIELGEQAINVATELKNLNLVVDEGAKKKDIAGLEQKKDNLLPLEQEAALHKIIAAGIKSHEDALRKLAETMDSFNSGGRQGFEAELAAIETNRVAAINAADDVLEQQTSDREADVLAAGNDFAKVAEINAGFANQQMAHNDAVRQADAVAASETAKAKLTAALEAIKTELDARVKAAQQGTTAAANAALETTEIQKTQNTQTADDISNKEKLGLISKREALAETIVLLNREYEEREDVLKKELAGKEAALASEIAAEQDAAAAILSVNGGNKADPRYKEYLIQINALLVQQAELEKKAAADSVTASNERNTGILKTQQDLFALNNSWASYFTKMNQETNTLAATFRGTLQTSMTNAMSSFNRSIAQSIVEGKNFGQAMRQVAASFLENMIEAGLRWLENWIIQHTLAAAFANTSAASQFATQKIEAVSLAGANAVASFALAPFPIDLGAPAFGASMAAAAAAFNQGGIVPGVGNTDSVHALLTPGEAVLPQAMTEKLSDASSGGSHHHYHYAPTNNIKAWDSTDMKEELMKHKTEFFKEARREARRRA